MPISCFCKKSSNIAILGGVAVNAEGRDFIYIRHHESYGGGGHLVLKGK